MANGTFSVQAILSAYDKNLSSTFNKATQTANNFGTQVKSVVAGLGITKALGVATNLLSSSLDGAITRYDTLHSYPKVMKSLGYSTEDAESSVAKLNQAVQGLPTSLADIVSSAQKLTSVTGNMDKATDTAIALNNALLASSASTEDVSRATQQYSQMLAVGKVDMQSWRTLQETMSPALSKVAKQLGITSGSTQELYNSLKEGSITFDQLNEALITCSNETGGFADTAREASRSIRTGFSNIKSAVENFEMSVIGAVNNIIDSQGFGGIVDILDKVKGAIYSVRNAFMESENGIDYVFKPEVLQTVTSLIDGIRAKMTGMWDAFKDTGAIEAVKGAIESVQGALSHVMDSVNWSDVLNTIAETVGQLVTKFSQLAQKCADFVSAIPPDVLNSLAQGATKLFEAFIAYTVISSATSKVVGFGKACADQVGNVKSMYTNVKNFFKALGGSDKPTTPTAPTTDPTTNLVEQSTRGASIIQSIFEGISSTIKSVGQSIKSVFQGIGDVVESLGKAIESAGKAIQSVFEGIGSVIESVGTAIKSILEGLAPVVESLGTALATVAKGIGEGISIALQGLGKALASVPPTTWLAIAAAALAFGVALALVGSQGEGLNMVLQGVATVITSFAPIVQTVVDGIVAVVQTLPSIFESIGTAIQSVFEGVATVVESVGEVINGHITAVSEGIATVVDALGGAISGVLDSIAGIIESIGTAALNAGAGFESLAQGISTITGLNLLDMGASLAAVATGIGAISAASVGLSGASTNLQNVITALQKLVTMSETAGTQIGNNVIKGVTQGFNRLPQIANTAVSSMISVLNSARARAYSAGSFIGQGLAQGLASQVGAVQAQASRLAAAADEAIRAKARIASPSKVARKNGSWIGEGLALGIEDMQARVHQASEDLFELPRLVGQDLNFGMDTSLNDNYSYSQDVRMNVTVPLEVNGRQFAKATYNDSKRVENERSKLTNRLMGVR